MITLGKVHTAKPVVIPHRCNKCKKLIPPSRRAYKYKAKTLQSPEKKPLYTITFYGCRDCFPEYVSFMNYTLSYSSAHHKESDHIVTTLTGTDLQE